ncbi:MAG: GlmU family protein [Ignavibacterium album]|uniref:GlmU family protein n=1 Tax=Ignavibacterium album TaxID=591197 RepID=UPI0026EBE7E0|nr:GlmU family protein [Ignavibacterium album]MCX8105235.1 GlmU family protein [Ignavibacterium album]
MQICIFEDIEFSNLEPLIFNRPVYDLLCGTSTLKEKILRSYGNINYSLHTRPYLKALVEQQNPGIPVNQINDDYCLFINGRIIAPKNLSEILPLIETEDKVFVNEETVVAAYLSGERLKKRKSFLNDLFSISDFEGLPLKIIDIKCAGYIWDLMNINGSQIKEESEYFINETRNNYVNILPSSVHTIKPENIFIGKNAVVKPGVVLDASNGPIIIEEDVEIFPNAVIEGPCFIGKGSKIKSCATIYENVTIGNTCKIGGEVEQSVFMPYSNKQHSGFIGHAYIGSWVNLGADTNNSDLKNNYSTVKATIGGKEIETGLQFLGLMMGDHSKSAINTMFNTGTVVGFSCNIFGPGFPDKYIPSFSWGGAESMTTYDVNKSMQTAKVVMSRRKVEFTKADEEVFKTVFELTSNERQKRGI